MVRQIVSAPSPAPAAITLSLVSHGHEALVRPLLARLAELGAGALRRVVLTHNLPARPLAPALPGLPFELREVFNPAAQGFGSNHNAAFALCETPFFCVLNPDIELPDAAIFDSLLRALEPPGTGCAYPRLLDAAGRPQDNEREALTPAALWRRRVRHQPQRRADWTSAAFWLVRSEAWRAIGGFDARYFMYCEDADFCLRLQLAGWRLARAEAVAVHAAARSSHRDWRALRWHLASLLRHWRQPPLRRYLAARAKARQ